MKPTSDDYQAWLPHVCQAAREAGAKILEIYSCPECGIEKKSDGSPVTLADKAADGIIRQALSALTPDIPVVSEENVLNTPFDLRRQWSVFWLVDPLDGTKEFIERTGEFCVNIALIVEGKAVLGVVFGPLENVLYSAYQNGQATKVFQGNIQILKVAKVHKPIKVAVSRRHGSRVGAFMQALGDTRQVNMGSALKSCLVAEGSADVYPRFGPTSHWDTAACQIIVEAAGGRIVDAAGEALTYQPSEDLLNPFFMVIGDTAYPWPNFPM